MAIKLIDIDQGNTNELPGPFYCPACSKLVFGREGYGKSICNHVLFTFLSEGYEFENVNPIILPKNWTKV